MKFILIIWTAYACCNNSVAEFDSKVACEQAKNMILTDLEQARLQRIEFMKTFRAAPLTDKEILANYPQTRGECFIK